MQTRVVIAFILFTSISMSSCSLNECGRNKDHFLENFAGLIDETTEANLAYSDPAWKAYDERFISLVEDCYPEYESELSLRERRRFWGKYVKYYYKRYGASAAKELLAKGDAGVDEISISLGDFPQEELEDLLETIGDDVENWGQEFENWADKLLDAIEQ
ncbi:MAG: hypothetical protein GYB31_04760 [Bacteroidetes bacterium]|nr:hypothetical protein [Bacteroidota bacterium]